MVCEWSRKRGAWLVTSLVMMVIGSVTLQAAEDKVFFKAGGTVSSVDGAVKKDELHEVVITSGGTEIKKKRSEVDKVVYGMVPEEFYQVDDLLEAGDLENADKMLEFSLTRAKRNADFKTEKGKLFMQHWLIRKANLSMRRGDFPTALKAYTDVVRTVPNSAWYFEARLGEAKANVKMGNNGQALEKYSLWVREFTQVIDKFSLGKTADGFLLQAELGKMAMNVEQILAAKEPDKILLDKALGEFKALTAKYTPDREATKAAMLLKAVILAGQNNWKEVIPLLDTQIVEAQLEDRKDELFSLYMKRANAAFQSGEFRGAQIDYLRLWLEFEAEGPEGAMAHLRLGSCIQELKDKEWELRSRRHFAWAKASQQEPYATEAGEELKKMKDTEEAPKSEESTAVKTAEKGKTEEPKAVPTPKAAPKKEEPKKK